MSVRWLKTGWLWWNWVDACVLHTVGKRMDEMYEFELKALWQQRNAKSEKDGAKGLINAHTHTHTWCTANGTAVCKSVCRLECWQQRQHRSTHAAHIYMHKHALLRRHRSFSHILTLATPIDASSRPTVFHSTVLRSCILCSLCHSTCFVIPLKG